MALVCVLVGTSTVVFGREPIPAGAGVAAHVECLPCPAQPKDLPVLSKLPGIRRLCTPAAVPTAPTTPAATGRRLHHLRLAADHLEAAGEIAQAHRLRQQADQEVQTLLERLAMLQAEVDRLRRARDPKQQVLVHIQMMEVSRTKLRKLGFDFSTIDGSFGGCSAVKAGNGSPVGCQLLGDTKRLVGLLDALRQDGLAKVLAEPTLVTVSGRPCAFSSGHEIPVRVAQDSGKASIEYRKLGTEVDLLPVVLENGRIRLEFRAKCSRLDPKCEARFEDGALAGLRTHAVETGVEMQPGQTLLLGGLIQRHAGKRTVEPAAEDDAPEGKDCDHGPEPETELLVLITPRIVEPTDASAAACRPAISPAGSPPVAAPYAPPVAPTAVPSSLNLPASFADPSARLPAGDKPTK